MENKSPAFQWYPKDILASARVQMMSMTEECAYRRLIDYCWLHGSVPADAQRAARLVGKGCPVEAAKIALEMFEPHPTDQSKLVHDRLEAEREKQASNSKARSEAAAARWNKQGKSKGEAEKQANGKQVKPKADANAIQTDMQNDALHISSSSSTAFIEEDTHTAQDAGFQYTDFGEINGISASQLVDVDTSYRDRCAEGFKTRLNAPVALPQEFEYFKLFDFCETNKYPVDDLFQAYDLLEAIRAAKQADWKVTPKLLESNVGKVETLKQELTKLLEKNNGTGKTTNYRTGNSNGHPAATVDLDRFDSPTFN